MSALSTHVLDTTTGTPARGLPVTLEVAKDPATLHGVAEWAELARGVTDGDGRIARFGPELVSLEATVYRLRFATGLYFQALGVRAFYPEVDVIFQIHNPREHHHVPLLLSPFGYSTYRGS